MMSIPVTLGLVTTALLLCAVVTLTRILRDARPSAPPPSDAILAFGAGIWTGGQPSLTLRTRATQAARLYQEGLAPVILCSGGYSGGTSEARVMRALLIEQGVPADVVIPDDSGVSTRDALQSAKGFAHGRWQRILAVSSPYHLHRVRAEARRQGLIVATSPATRSAALTWRYAFSDGRQYLRELSAVWQYAITGTWSRLFRCARTSVPMRALSNLSARFRFLFGGADGAAASSEAIGHHIKVRIAGFSDTHVVLTPASGLQWPAVGAVGDRFGLRHGRLHAGVDIRTGHGAPVRAASGGDVLFAGWMRAYGNVAVIHHGGGLATVYAHLAGLIVAEGESVPDRQLIGFAGATGRASGPHLHFEVRVHGSPVDPLVYLQEKRTSEVFLRFS